MAEEITRPLLRQLQADMDEALKAVAQKHGVSIEVGNASFTSQNATFKVQVAVTGKGGVADTREAQDFRIFATSYGLTPDDLGQTFPYGGKEYTIVGLSRKSSKYPILCKKNGENVRLPVESVIGGLAIKRAKK